MRLFQLKPLALLHSDLEDILLLDSDNCPVKDPSFLAPGSPLSFVGMDMTARQAEHGIVYGVNQESDVALRGFLDEQGVSYNTGVQCPLPEVRGLYDDSELLGELIARANEAGHQPHGAMSQVMSRVC